MEADYFKACMSDFEKLVSVVMGEHGEIAGGTLEKDEFDNATTQKKQKVGFNCEGTFE